MTFTNKLEQYLQNLLQLKNLKHKVYEHILNELHDDNLFMLENDLGAYVGIYIYNLQGSLKEFESIVNTEIEVNKYDKIEVEAILAQKQQAESVVKNLLEYYQEVARQKTELKIRMSNQFETYFNSLYSSLNNFSDNEIRESLQAKADEITKALHDAKHNYTITEFAENHIKRLKELRKSLEDRIQNSFVVKRVEPKVAQSKEDEKRKQQKYIVGMLFARGKLNKYFSEARLGGLLKKDNAPSFPKIANELGYNDITEIKGNSIRVILRGLVNNNDKSVFDDLFVMQIILNDCNKQNIKVHPYFLKRFEELKAKTI